MPSEKDKREVHNHIWALIEQHADDQGWSPRDAELLDLSATLFAMRDLCYQHLDEGTPLGEVRNSLSSTAMDAAGVSKTTWQQDLVEARASGIEPWREVYSEYLKSDRWGTMRAKVMKRAEYVCEGCLEMRAEHVHHMTYDRVGCELATDLVAYCGRCHEHYHETDKAVKKRRSREA